MLRASVIALNCTLLAVALYGLGTAGKSARPGALFLLIVAVVNILFILKQDGASPSLGDRLRKKLQKRSPPVPSRRERQGPSPSPQKPVRLEERTTTQDVDEQEEGEAEGRATRKMRLLFLLLVFLAVIMRLLEQFR